MKIAVITIVYSTVAAVDSLLKNAMSGDHSLECHLFRHSGYPQLALACEQFARNPAVRYYPFEGNRGVSRSWNEGMLAAFAANADAVIIVNDDISFSQGDVVRLAERACAHRDRYIVSCAGHHRRRGQRLPSCGYACFAINPIALETLGCFDENFFPAYCEDQDYARRAALAGLSEENCADTQIVHMGSNAIFSDAMLLRQNSITHGRNMAYYRRKWGGDAGRETFARPFNDPALGLRIPAERRSQPYGISFDRQDRNIVVR